MRLARFIALCILSLGVAAYAVIFYGFLPLGAKVHPEMRAAFEANRLGIYSHVFGSAIALALGPFQFSSRLRNRSVSLHRWLGRVYLGIGVLIGGVSGLYMAFHAFGGVPARLGFGCLAVAWLYSGLQAYLAIRAGDVAAHRAWMVRNFSLTFGAVTLRLHMLILTLSGVEFETTYPIVSWLSWVPNLLVAEILVRGRERR